MNTAEIGWLAGIFDGAGSICIEWPKRSAITVEIKMASEVTIRRIHELFPGNVKEGQLSGWGIKKQWRWRLSTNKGRHFLKLLEPYLITKKRHAELALDFLSVRDHRLTSAERERRDRIEREWRKLITG